MNWLSTVGQWWLAHWQIYLGFGVVYATWLGTCRWRIESTLKLAYGGGISPECHWIFRIFFPLYFILADDVEDDFPVWTLLWGKKSGDWRRWLAWPMTIAFAPIQFMVFAVAWIIAFSCLLGLLCVIAYSKRLEQPHPILARK